MKRKQLLIIIIIISFALIAIMLITAALSRNGRTSDGQSGKEVNYIYYETAISPSPGDVQIQSIIEYAEHMLISVYYPSTGIESIDQDLANQAESFVREFKSNAGTIPAEGNNVVAELNVSYLVYAFGPDFISVKFEKQMVYPDREPVIELKTMVYEKETGKIFALADFFRKDSNHLALISSLLIDRILTSDKKDGFYDEATIRDSLSPTAEHFTHFVLDGNRLILFFEPGEISPYDAGTVKIEIPIRQLSDTTYFKAVDPPASSEALSSAPPSSSDNSDSSVTTSEAPKNKRIALTFDDGPHQTNTPHLLDLLQKYNAKATFFVVGNRVPYFPELLQRMVKEGHTIGNHTYSHKQLSNLNSNQILEQIRKTNAEVFDACGYTPTILRPPYGSLGSKVKTLDDMTVVLWTIDSRDWELKDAQKIADGILKDADDGDIVLLHDLYDFSVDAAEIVMKELSKQGYEFVTVDVLLDLK